MAPSTDAKPANISGAARAFYELVAKCERSPIGFSIWQQKRLRLGRRMVDYVQEIVMQEAS